MLLARMGRNRCPYTLPVGMHRGALELPWHFDNLQRDPGRAGGGGLRRAVEPRGKARLGLD